MRKKLVGILTILIMIFMCGFATACGDEYKDMQFKIEYAFSEDDEMWYDATDSLSLNYGSEKDELKLEDGIGNIYFRVSIQNVKEKYIDSIVITDPNGIAGFITVKQNQVFSLPISSNVRTCLNFYETKSGKSKNIDLAVFESLTAIDVDDSRTPAVSVGGSLDLDALINSSKDGVQFLNYEPIGKTNQTAVDFEIVSWGKYEGSVYSPNATPFVDKIKIENRKLVVDSSTQLQENYVVKIRAISQAHNEEDDMISAEFDVLLIENVQNAGGVTYSPKIYEYGQTEAEYLVTEKTLYVDDTTDYATKVDINISDLTSIYVDGINYKGKTIKYGVKIYIDDEEYDLDSRPNADGLYISQLSSTDTVFSFEIESTQNEVNQNIVKFKVVPTGLDLDYAVVPEYVASLNVKKSALVTGVTIKTNGVIYTQSSVTEAIYKTTSDTYKGLDITLEATSIYDSPNSIITFEKNANLIISGAKLTEDDTTYSVKSGDLANINIKFKNNVTSSQQLVFKTAQKGEIGEVSTTLTLNLLVTANKIEMLSNILGESQNDGEIYTSATFASYVYVKVLYSGTSLSTDTIALSLQDDMTFTNNTANLSLDKAECVVCGETYDSQNKYDIYKIGIKQTGTSSTSNLEAVAGNGQVGVSAKTKLTSVYVVENEDFEFVVSGENISTMQDQTNKYAITQDLNKRADFKLQGKVQNVTEKTTNAIADITITRADSTNEHFAKNATSITKISKHEFDMVGVTSGKTQKLSINVSYYKQNEDGVIELSSTEVEVQIAVYSNINTIDVSCDKTNNTIVYVNSVYDQARLAEITYNSYAKSGSAPTNTVYFENELGEEIAINDVSTIQVEFSQKDTNVIIYDALQQEITNEQAVDLQGTIYTALTNTAIDYNNITITFNALRFGETYEVSRAITILFGEHKQSTGILLSGNDIVTENGGNNVYMSFLDVEDGSSATTSFSAFTYYNSISKKSDFNNFDYAISQVEQNDDGTIVYNADNTVKYVAQAKTRLNVAFDYENDLVTISASKALGGGIFKFELFALDSYDDLTGEYTIKKVIFIQIADGVKNAFAINDEQDFLNIKNHLKKDYKYMLTADLTFTNYTPMGIDSSNMFSDFCGKLYGASTIIDAETNTSVEIKHTITIKITSTITDDENVYAGLFASLGSTAIIDNLNLKVEFDLSSVESKSQTGILYIGGLAGRAKSGSQINDVSIDVSFDLDLTAENITTGINIAGLVGYNEGQINLDSVVNVTGNITTTCLTTPQRYAGVTAYNSGEIVGGFEDVEDLETIDKLVIANLDIKTTIAITNPNPVEMVVGGVVGLNVGNVKNLLVSGKIAVAGKVSGSVGAICGESTGTISQRAYVKNSAVLGCDITGDQNTSLKLAGAVGKSTYTTYNAIKIFATETVFANQNTTYGKLTSLNADSVVAGLIAYAESDIINQCSVENLVKQDDFTMINGVNIVAGAVYGNNASTLDSIYVSANLKGNVVYSLSNKNTTNAYFIGKITNVGENATIDHVTNSTSYAVLIGDQITTYHNGTTEPRDITNYVTETTIATSDLYSTFNFLTNLGTIDEDTYNASENLYVLDGTYKQPTQYDSATSYYQLNTTNWEAKNNDVYIADINGNLVKCIATFDANTTYYVLETLGEHNNFVELYTKVEDEYVKNTSSTNINLTTTYYSLAFRSDEYLTSAKALIANIDSNAKWSIDSTSNTIKVLDFYYYFPILTNVYTKLPTDLFVNIDNDYITSINSIYVGDYEPSDTQITISQTAIINFRVDKLGKKSASELNTYNITDIISTTIVPSGAVGGISYEVVEGRDFAYIENNAQIVFTKATGNSKRIVVKCYSLFNSDLVEYVELHTQYGLTSLEIESTDVDEVNDVDYRYELSTYLGADESNIKITAVNTGKNNTQCYSIFDADILQYLTISCITESNNLTIESVENNFGEFTIEVKSSLDFTTNFKQEVLTFEVKLNLSSYLGYGSDTAISLGKIKLAVNINKSASDLQIVGTNQQIASSKSFTFDAILTTGYVNAEETENKNISYDIDENTIELIETNKDSLLVEISANNEQETTRLLQQAGVTYITELFDYAISYAKQDSQTLKYTFIIGLKDEFNYRYLLDNITFTYTIKALTNREISQEVVITYTPTSLGSVRLNNYVVTHTDAQNIYTNIIEGSNVETSLIEPGGLGGLMLVYLQPNYANVKQAIISSSTLYVPSEGRNVKITFEQVVYDEVTGKYVSLYPRNETTENGIKLSLVTSKNGTNYSYNGVIYVQTILDKFSGLRANIDVTLQVETLDDKVVTQTKSLVTEYVPGTKLSFAEGYNISTDTYLIEQDTYENIVDLKIYGYEFNSNPNIELVWADDTITDDLSNYVAWRYVDGYQDVSQLTKNADGSYTIKLQLYVRQNLVNAFKLKASLSLISSTGTIQSNDSVLTFYPVDYILKGISLNNGSVDIKVNDSALIDLNFTTTNAYGDATSVIYARLLESLTSNEKSLKQAIKVNYNSGLYDLTNTFDEFEITETNNKLTIFAKHVCSFSLSIDLYYSYIPSGTDDVYTLAFTSTSTNVLSASSNVTISNRSGEKEYTAITTAEQMSNLEANKHYILMNDITLSQFTPITTQIGSFDGNNKVIKITSFAEDTNVSEYGLFGTISTYTEDTTGETEKTKLLNIIVDYSNFNTTNNGLLSLKGISDVTFGGLVAVNNGGIIYNCDVVNTNTQSQALINILVDNDATLTFGGLVGENNGNITNSRVGRTSYQRVNVTSKNESTTTVALGRLSFVLGNSTKEENASQGFEATVGGFVGVNDGVIVSSFVNNTSIYSHSTSTDSQLAGFVGENGGEISYSYIKGGDGTISATSPYATTEVIEGKTNGKLAGFVYTNKGTISNAYANIKLVSKSSYTAGFVYSNQSGAYISEAYAANYKTEYKDSEQPFVGVNSEKELLSYGTMENVFYLTETGADLLPNNPLKLDQAWGYNANNFQNDDALTNFVFVASDSMTNREQGIWSHYNINGEYRILPELVIADNIATSCRYEYEVDGKIQFVNASNYQPGTKNNPEIISSAEEYNNILASKNSFTGYVRFVDDIDFGGTENLLIKTRSNYTLGGEKAVTSIEGNGMTISNVYLDLGEIKQESVGLFAQIKNAFVKDLNIEFVSGDFASANATYSGGLAGKISDSYIYNINLDGATTTINGYNFVGGLSGIIEGESVISSITSNVSVKSNWSGSTEVYSSVSNYKSNMSYAGGIAGVIDIENSTKATYELSYITINGGSLSISGTYAGGIAGYANKYVTGLRTNYNVGNADTIKGEYAAGGLYGIMLGRTVASQVTNGDDDIQFSYDSILAEYVLDLDENDQSVLLNKTELGNTTLISSNLYAGGLSGITISATFDSCYAKASFDVVTGGVYGGLVGLAIRPGTQYSYSVPYFNLEDYEIEEEQTDLTYLGGMYGKASANSVLDSNLATVDASPDKNGTRSAYSTFMYDQADLINLNLDDTKITADYFCANDYTSSGLNYITTINYDDDILEVENRHDIRDLDAKGLYDSSDATTQSYTYTKIFGMWDTRYWNLDYPSKYYPLLNNEKENNDEEIATASDFEKIKANPSGNFVIVNDIDMSNYATDGNYILDVNFTGKLYGDKGNGEVPKLYNLSIEASNSEQGSGFFASTDNAIIQTIIFEWNGINVNTNIKSIGLVSYTDTNSMFTNLTIQTSTSGYLATCKDSSTVTGYGGIVGNGTNSYISDCLLSGSVNLNTTGASVGGVVGRLEANGNTEYDDSYKPSTILSTTILSDITINSAVNNLYVGGAVGYVSNASIDSVVTYEIDNTITNPTPTTQTISIANANADMYVGGLAGYSLDSIFANCDARSAISTNGTTENTKQLAIGGMIGKYSISNKVKEFANNFVYSSTITLADAIYSAVYLSMGIGEVENKAELQSSMFEGTILADTQLKQVYAGGVVGGSASGVALTISEIMADVLLDINATGTVSQYYLGGILGGNNNSNIDLTLSNCATLGRILPGCEADETTQAYVGGFAGNINSYSTLANSINYSLSSIIRSNLGGEAIKDVNASALFANIANPVSDSSADGRNIYYSTDISLVAEEQLSSAQNYGALILLQSAISGYDTTVWTKPNDTTNAGLNVIPYITDLQDKLRSVGILNVNVYTSGTILNPIIVSEIPNISEEDDSYQYYYLQEDAPINSVSRFNGVLIASDKDYEYSSTSALITTLEKGSVISNLHVLVTTEDDFVYNQVTIVNDNYGVIFNSSVQGNADVTNSKGFGLITTTNYGLVCNCYSSAEISATNSVGGICLTNYSTIVTCYFTGHLECSNTSAFTAGIAYESKETTNYIYNCYMAGSVTNIKTNSFVGGLTFKGDNNYLDQYANLEISTNLEGLPITKVTTYELMRNKVGDSALLKGSWKITVEDNYIATYSDTYGYNYCYPICTLGKNILSSGNITQNYVMHQRYTGKGFAVDDAKDVVVTTDVLEASLDTSANEERDYFNILHYGLLTAVQGLANTKINTTNSGLTLVHTNFNYKLCYDIDGKVASSSGVTIQPIGGTAISGWYHEEGSQFNGYFISQNSKGEPCTVKNLKGSGLFTNVGNAYFKDLILGDMTELRESGGLIVSTLSGEYQINIDSISLVGANFGGKNFSALVGTLQSNLVVTGLQTATGSGLSVSNVCTLTPEASDKENAYAGLIAYKIEGGELEVGEDSKDLYVQVGEAIRTDKTYIGGLVGITESATITRTSETADYIVTVHFAISDTINGFGGMIGNVNGETTIEYYDVSPLLKSGGSSFTFNANMLGMIACVVSSGPFTITNCSICKDKPYDITADYFGYISAQISAKTIVNNVVIKGSENNQVDKVTNIDCQDENKDNNGYGVFTGLLSGGDLTLLDTSASQYLDELQLIVKTGYNLGVIAGVYTSGTITIPDEDNALNKDNTLFENVTVKLSGVHNVGGMFGYFKSSNNVDELFTTNTAEEKISYINLLADGIAFAEISLEGLTDVTEVENIGGLIGELGVAGETTITVSLTAGIVNANTINFSKCFESTNKTGLDQEVIKAKNIGGVAGLCNANLSNANNTGDILVGNAEETSTYYLISFVSSKHVLSMNVGGVIGSVGTESYAYTLKNLTNEAQVIGYYNVGGIIGNMQKSTLANYSTAGDASDGTRKYQKQIVGDIERYYPISTQVGSGNSYVATGNSGLVIGAINVGTIGTATDCTIEGVLNYGTIKASTNVGGLVGLATKSTISNCEVGVSDASAEISMMYIVYEYVVKEVGINTYYREFIFPTNVGGMFGEVTKSVLTNNQVKALITSVEEGNLTFVDSSNYKNGSQVISTISNNMCIVDDGEKDPAIKYSETKGIYVPKEVKFNEMTTGVGGFAGKIDSTSALDYEETIVGEDGIISHGFVIETNTISAAGADTNIIKAQIGINVGGMFGYYDFEEGKQSQDEDDETWYFLKVPTLNSEISISGGYNIGGVVGCLDNEDEDEISYEYKVTQTINVQPNYVGMYVGGIFGSVTGNINNLQATTTQNGADTAQIVLSTDDNYYVGGLVGKLQGNMLNGVIYVYDAEKQAVTTAKEKDGNSVLDNDGIAGSVAERFGGLVGMAKVKAGATYKDDDNNTVQGVRINGTHNYPFTVNIVENSDYADGESSFTSDVETDATKINLYARARYVNLDSFDISASKTSYDKNPLNGSDGWHKDYTIFKSLQRCIPAEENCDKWDSIAVLYDAGNIFGVGTNVSDEKYTVEETAYYNTDIGDTGDNIFTASYTQADFNTYIRGALEVNDKIGDEIDDWFESKDSNGVNISYALYENLQWGKDESKANQYRLRVDVTRSLPQGSATVHYYFKKHIAQNENIAYTIYLDDDETPMLYTAIGIAILGEQSGNEVDFDDIINRKYVWGDGTYYYADTALASPWNNSTSYVFVFNSKFSYDKENDIVYSSPDGSIFNVSGVQTKEGATSKIDWEALAIGIAAGLVAIGLIILTKGLAAPKIAVWLAAIAAIGASTSIAMDAVNQFANSIKSRETYLQQIGSFGYLSSMTSRDIIYQLNEETGQYELVADSGYIYYDEETGFSYLAYSNCRPSDYYSTYYMCTSGDSENFMQDVTTSSYSSTHVQADDITSLYYKSTENNNIVRCYNENESIGAYIVYNNGSSYCFKKYIYHAGMYYVNQYATTTEYTLNNVDLSTEDMSLLTNSRYQKYVVDNIIYISGSYDSSTGDYSWFEDDSLYRLGNLKYNSSKGEYYIDGLYTDDSNKYPVEIRSETAETKITVTFGYDSNFTAAAYSDLEGYYYITGGFTTKKPTTIDETSVKVAKFVNCGQSKPTGVLGADYIEIKHTYYVEGIFDDPFYLANEDEYNEFGETLYYCPEGSEEKVVAPGYFENELYYKKHKFEETYYYTFSGFETGAQSSITVRDGYTTKSTAPVDEVYVNMYPTINGYEGITTSSDSRLECYFQRSGSSNSIVSKEVTYYLYQGGYVYDVASDTIYSRVPTASLDYNITLSNNGIAETIPLSELLADWDKYNKSCYKYNGKSISYTYRVAEVKYMDNYDQISTKNALFMRNTEYSITCTQDATRTAGLLYRVSTSYNSNSEEYNNNQYLTNSQHAFYTRYKYMEAEGTTLQVSNLENAIFDSDGTLKLIPSGNGGTINSGKTTFFTERVQVTLSGNAIYLINNDTYQITATPGKFTIR